MVHQVVNGVALKASRKNPPDNSRPVEIQCWRNASPRCRSSLTYLSLLKYEWNSASTLLRSGWTPGSKMWQQKTRNNQNDVCKLDCHALLPNLDDWMINQEVEMAEVWWSGEWRCRRQWREWCSLLCFFPGLSLGLGFYRWQSAFTLKELVTPSLLLFPFTLTKSMFTLHSMVLLVWATSNSLGPTLLS